MLSRFFYKSILVMFLVGQPVLAESDDYCKVSKPKEYKFSKHLSLQANLKQFSTSEGWQLVWSYPGDFPVLADVAHTGTLTCENSVVRMALSFAAEVPSNIRPPRVKFDFLNRVIQVRENPKSKSLQGAY